MGGDKSDWRQGHDEMGSGREAVGKEREWERGNGKEREWEIWRAGECGTGRVGRRKHFHQQNPVHRKKENTKGKMFETVTSFSVIYSRNHHCTR